MLLYGVLDLFGCFAGVTTVLFGFGGGFVVVPLMYRALLAVYGAKSAIGQSAMHIAVATSTCVMLFGAGLASWRHHRAGTIDWGVVRGMSGWIGLGALAGAAVATTVNGDWIRWLFVAYIALTIADCVLRPGFVVHARSHLRPWSAVAGASAGSAIGFVAAFLGVGGSVMTVPLMRRRGLTMTRSTALANPLSLPVALAATLMFSVLSPPAVTFGSGYLGYVDLGALAVLVLGSWLGIRLSARYIGRIPDVWHARIYLALLTSVMLAMMAGGAGG